MPYLFPILVNDRVALAPHTDDWMRGSRFGTVVERSRNSEGVLRYCIRLDYSTEHGWFTDDDLLGTVRRG